MLYSKQEMSRILDNPALSARDRVIANLSLGCAMRRCEIVGLSMGDVKLPLINLPAAVVKGGKSGRNPGRKFNVPIRRTLEVLAAWYAKRVADGATDADPFVTTRDNRRMSLRNLNWIWEKIAAAVPDNRCTSHSGRHSLSTLLVEEKIADPRDIQRLLGHKSLATTERYLHDQCQLQTVDLL